MRKILLFISLLIISVGSFGQSKYGQTGTSKSVGYKITSPTPLDANYVWLHLSDTANMPLKFNGDYHYFEDVKQIWYYNAVKWQPLESGSGGIEYTLPAATTTTLGGVKVGTGLNVTADGTLTASGLGTETDPTVPSFVKSITTANIAVWNAPPWASVTGKPTFATVATSGSYNDLSNRPTIPAAQVQTDWNATTGLGVLLNKPTTLNGYGITDAYTQSQLQTSGQSYVHWNNVYSKPNADRGVSGLIALPVGTGTSRYFREDGSWTSVSATVTSMDSPNGRQRVAVDDQRVQLWAGNGNDKSISLDLSNNILSLNIADLDADPQLTFMQIKPTGLVTYLRGVGSGMAGGLTFPMGLYNDSVEPDIPTNSFAFWVNGSTFWLILDSGGVQKKIQLQ